MATASKEPKEADIVLSRVDVALARSRRIIASWLPQRDESEGLDEEQQLEDSQIEQGDSELFGVGFVPETSSEPVRKETSSLELLRKQILGKRAGDKVPKRPKVLPVGQTPVSKPNGSAPSKPATMRRRSMSEDEDEGRATAITSKKRKAIKYEDLHSSSRDGFSAITTHRLPRDLDEDLPAHDESPPPQGKELLDGKPTMSSPGTRKSVNFLDEILAEKKNKRKKRRKITAEQGHTSTS